MKKLIFTSFIILVFTSYTKVDSSKPFLKKAIYEMLEALKNNDEVGIKKYFYTTSNNQITSYIKSDILKFCSLNENQFKELKLIGTAVYEIPYINDNLLDVFLQLNDKVYVLKFSVGENSKFTFTHNYVVYSEYNAVYPHQYSYDESKKINLLEVIKYSKWTFAKEPSNQNELIEQGKTLFSEKTCAACHLPDGSGLIGPNHTDNYWLFGNTYDDVFHTITYGGRKGKGMVAWGNIISEEDRMKLTYYVLSLHNKPIIGKSPEGKLYED